MGTPLGSKYIPYTCMDPLEIKASTLKMKQGISSIKGVRFRVCWVSNLKCAVKKRCSDSSRNKLTAFAL